MVVCVSLKEDRFEIRCPYNAATVAFLRTLPRARWNRTQLAWHCDATPAAAYKLCRETPMTVQAEQAVRDMADNFQKVSQSPANEADQPAIRKHDSRKHQVAGYHFAMSRPAAMLAHEMGAGKSKVAVDIVQNRDCKAVLILCPVSVRGVWRREFAKWGVKDYRMIVLEHGSVARKIKDAAEQINSAVLSHQPFVLVTNYETARDKQFRKFAATITWDMIILDESHRAKSHNSEISKACHELGQLAKYRLCLTGTPMPHSPLDLFGQFRFLDSGVFGTAFGQFRSMYTIEGPLGPHHVIGYRNQEHLAERMRLLSHSVRMTDTEIDLPPVSHHTLTATLEDDRGYRDLEREMIAKIGDGTITAANALVKMLRLQQWTSGFVVDDDGTERMTGTEKRKLLEDLLSDLPPSEPVVVFGNFVRSLDTVEDVAKKLSRTYGEVSGRRKDLTPNAEMPEGIQILGVQIAAGGVGIDLTRARYAVYFDHGWSLGNYEQSLARPYRPGQTRHVHFYHLIIEKTADVATFNALAKKKQVVEAIIDCLKGGVSE